MEPEAAALYFFQDFVQMKKVTETSYLVVDCGGETVDIVAQKMIINGKGEIFIEELSPPERGDYGGFDVNKNFENLLQDIFSVSNEQFAGIKEKHSRYWLKMIWETFEMSKCSVLSGLDYKKSIIPIHRSIRHEVLKITGKTIEDLVAAYKKQPVDWDPDEDSIVLPYSTMHGLYNATLVQITAHANSILSKSSCRSITMVFLVGGFAESSLLYDEVRNGILRVHQSVKVVKTIAPALSVVKGAVIFGQNEGIIKSVGVKG